MSRPKCDSCRLEVTDRFVTEKRDDESKTLCDVCRRLIALGLIPQVALRDTEHTAK